MQATHPRTMTTLSTHDTKRSDDVRARLAVVTEMPARWRAALSKWARKNAQQQHILHVTWSSRKEWAQEMAFFGFFYIGVFFALTFLKQGFAPMAIPWADAFASATAYTGMWLMARKKVESWYWWIATNIASIPLYFVKHYVFTSVYYLVLLIMAISGLAEWRRRAKTIKYAA